MNYSPFPKGSTEQYFLLILAFSGAPRKINISQQQWGDQKVVVEAKKCLDLQKEDHSGAPLQNNL